MPRSCPSRLLHALGPSPVATSVRSVAPALVPTARSLSALCPPLPGRAGPRLAPPPQLKLQAGLPRPRLALRACGVGRAEPGQPRAAPALPGLAARGWGWWGGGRRETGLGFYPASRLSLPFCRAAPAPASPTCDQASGPPAEESLPQSRWPSR